MAGMKPLTLSPTLGLLALLALALPAQAEDWAPELTAQILEEEDCEVAFLTEVLERVVEEKLIVLAKVHCADKRSFDVSRHSDREPFDIRPCEEPDVSSC